MTKFPSLKVCNRIYRIPKKRAFFLSSGKTYKYKGSMAIEGGMIFPVFLLFMLTVLLSLEVVRLQSNVAEALYLSGNSYAASVWEPDKISEKEAQARLQIKEYLDKQFLPYICVDGGRNGMQVGNNSSKESGKVELTVNYSLASVIWWLPVGDIFLEDIYLGHAWTGYSGQEDRGTKQDKELYVYITETGSRYHLSDSCSYLKVKVTAIEAEWLEEGRNKWGAKYYPCDKCKPKERGILYVSEDGKNYHSHGDCSGLKRTIYVVPLCEAEGYSACSRCAK